MNKQIILSISMILMSGSAVAAVPKCDDYNAVVSAWAKGYEAWQKGKTAPVFVCDPVPTPPCPVCEVCPTCVVIPHPPLPSERVVDTITKAPNWIITKPRLLNEVLEWYKEYRVWFNKYYPGADSAGRLEMTLVSK